MYFYQEGSYSMCLSTGARTFMPSLHIGRLLCFNQSTLLLHKIKYSLSFSGNSSTVPYHAQFRPDPRYFTNSRLSTHPPNQSINLDTVRESDASGHSNDVQRLKDVRSTTGSASVLRRYIYIARQIYISVTYSLAFAMYVCEQGH